MSTVVKGPWPGAPGPSHRRNEAGGKTHKQVMEEYWRSGKMINPMHLNRPTVISGHEDSQPSLLLEEGELVTDGGKARAHWLNFMNGIRKEPER